jgi:hypothetical protein
MKKKVPDVRREASGFSRSLAVAAQMVDYSYGQDYNSLSFSYLSQQ